MLWGQRIKVYTNYKNLVSDTLGLICDPTYHWWLLLEEYSPKIVYIKGVDNVLADAVSWLDYDKKSNTRTINAYVRNMSLVRLFNAYANELPIATHSKRTICMYLSVPVRLGTI